MRSVKYVMNLILVLLLFVGAVLPSYAQDGSMVNCNGLSDADCEILMTSASQAQTVTSFSIPAMGGELMVTVGDETLEARVSGSADVVLPASLLAMASDMPQMDNMTDLAPLIQFYDRFTGEMVMEMLAEMGAHVVLDELVVTVPGEAPVAMSLEVIYKDMGLYLKLPSPVEREQWFGDSLEMSETDIAEMDLVFAELVEALQSDEMQQAMAQMSEYQGTANALTELVNTYVTNTRGEDVEMMGQSMAVFTTEFDLRGFLSDPMLGELILEALSNPALESLGSDMGDLEGLNATQIQFALMTVGLLVQDVEFGYTQYIGLDDMYLHKLEVNASANVDLSLFGEENMDALQGDLTFAIEFDDINSVSMDGVEVPTDFRSLDATDDFLAGGPSMIEGQLVLGNTFSGSFTGDDEQDVFSLSLAAGQTVQIEIESEDYPYLNLYGPDGFLIAELDTYDKSAITLDADEAGVYLIVVKAYWDMDYDLTVRTE